MKTNTLKHNQMTKDDLQTYVRGCVSVSPNNAEWQEIQVTCELYNGETIDLVFTPDDWLDTFTPSMYDRVRDSYINHLKQKK